MESLRDAAQAAKIEFDRRNAETARRQEIARQEREAATQAAEQLTGERALEFIEIMREANVPQVGLYEEIKKDVKDSSNHYGGYGKAVAGLIGPQQLGWMAAGPTMKDIEDVSVNIPGIFLDEQGRTYDCDNLHNFEGTEYVTSLSENPTALGDDYAFRRMANWLAVRGIV